METIKLREKIWASIPFDIHSKKLSYSRIKDLLISVKEYINNIANPKETTEPQKVGLVFECLLLEPEKFDEKFFINPEMPKFLNQTEQKKQGIKEPLSVEEQKEAFAKIVAEKAAGRMIITRQQYSSAINMVNGLNYHPLAKKLVSCEEREVQKKFNLTAGFEIVGALDVFCKAKEDIFINGKPLVKAGHYYILDLKKINNIEEKTIKNQIKDYKYYIQSYIYRMAIQQIVKSGKISLPKDQIAIPFYFIFQEDSAPYDTHVVELDSEYDKIAEMEIAKAFQIFKVLREEPEKLFFGINAGITTMKATKWQLDEVTEKNSRVQFTENNYLAKFMFEKDLDLSCAKPSVSVDLQNIFNFMELQKKEIEKSIDKKEEKTENAAGASTSTAPCYDESISAADKQIDDAVNPSAIPKRKRRTKEEMEAARESENISAGIFSAALTTSVESANVEPASLCVVMAKEQPKITMEDLIELGNKIKHFSTGLFAVKKTCHVLGFTQNLADIKLDQLTPEQIELVHINLNTYLKTQNDSQDIPD